MSSASRRPRPPPFDAQAARARPGAQMFANRLRKNLRQLRAWARREAVSCYRIYDADMPEYAFAIDLYQADPQGVNPNPLTPLNSFFVYTESHTANNLDRTYNMTKHQLIISQEHLVSTLNHTQCIIIYRFSGVK